MFSLWMFGRTLELEMGWKRFLIYYIVCGVGAALFQMGVAQIDLAHIEIDSKAWYAYMSTPTVGASGAIFGLLLAFGLLHPNALISLIFPPITLKAKWFVIIYGVLELLLGVTGSMSNVAHFAHLGGMFWGWLLLLWWRHQARKHNNYYN
jgi:membrane associated rhomboid family serine protease